MPLDGGSRDGMAESDIPLTNIRSNVSTGARKPNAGVSSGYDGENEKHGLHHRHHGRRRKIGPDGLKRQGTGDEIQMNALGRIYEKIVGFSIITRYMVYVIPVAILLAVPLVLLLVLDDPDERIRLGKGRIPPDSPGPYLWKLFLWIEISWATLWAGKIVAWFLPKIFMFFCGIVSAGVRKYATLLQNLNIPLSLFFWALSTFISFKFIFLKSNQRNVQWVEIVGQVFGALFASSAVLLVEKAFVQLIGVTYHQRSFANRIRESKREIRLLGILYEASRTLFPMYCEEFAEEDYVIDDSIEMMLHKRAGRKRAGSATPMRIIGGVGRVGDKVTSVFGNLASEITGKQVFNPNSSHSVVIEALEKRLPSEALARRIWMSFVCEGREALYLEDFYEVLGPAYTAEAEEAFGIIDADLNGDISLDEMVRKVVEVGQERKAITEGMKDIGQALQAFDKVLLFVVLLITIFIFLAFFRSSFVKVIASAGTALLSLSFVFAVTTQEFLGSCIFLFVKHPYDVGDRVDINDSQMVVDRISLLYTVFTRIDRMQVVQIPNIQLNNLWIDNTSRSKAMLECIDLDVSYDTSFEDIELLRTEMEHFVRHSDNSRDFQPDFSIGVGSVGNLDKMTLQITIKHKSNWHNDGVRATRRSKFMCALAVALKKVPIYGPGGGGDALGGPSNPTYSVSVTDAFAAKSREDSAKAKNDGRMVPANTNQSEKEQQQAEMQAISELTTRPLEMETTAGAWDAKDDAATIRSMDADDDPIRQREIESMRNSLKKKESQRGRRKAGEGLSHTASGNQHDSPRLETFDEEARTDMPSSFYERNHGEGTSYRGASGVRPSFDVGGDGGDELQLRPSMSQSQRGLYRGPSSGRRQPPGPPQGGH